MDAGAAVSSALLGFFNSLSQPQVNALQQVLNQTQSHNATQATSNVTTNMAASAGVTATTNGKKPRKKAVKSGRAAEGPPKRPLNSWMAFRKYYSASLAPNTQKSISKILTTWWRADPFEAKWAILAKAYSILRATREKADVPLDGFFAICAPLIKIIPPQQYQAVMGWQITPAGANSQDKAPQVIQVFAPNLAAIMQQYSTITPVGVNDLVSACEYAGFIRGQNTASLAMTAQPPATYGYEQQMMPPVSPDSAKLMDALTKALSEAPKGEAMLSDATIALHNAGLEYPYTEAFNPTAQFNFSFEPVIDGNDAFDSFDMTMAGIGGDNGGIEWGDMINEEHIL